MCTKTFREANFLKGDKILGNIVRLVLKEVNDG